jgi:hypothetical protein
VPEPTPVAEAMSAAVEDAEAPEAPPEAGPVAEAEAPEAPPDGDERPGPDPS